MKQNTIETEENILNEVKLGECKNYKGKNKSQWKQRKGLISVTQSTRKRKKRADETRFK